MPDNVTFQTTPATPPSGFIAATDQIPGTLEHVQIVKLADGTADATTRIVAGNGVAANALRVTLASDGTGVVAVTDNGGSLTVDGTVAISGSVAVTGPLTDTQLRASAVPISAASLPLPTGAATAAKQPALGTAGTPSADVISVQGVTSMTALKVDPSGVTSPISASSLPLPTGASTAAKQPALGTAGSASSDVLTVQGIASMTALKVDGSAVTQPVSGTVTATPSSPTTVLHGVTNVTTAGTRVVLAASTACQSVTIKAKSTNTGTIYVGSSTVSSTNGMALLSGDVVSFDIANLNTVNIDASVSGEGVTYLAVN